MQHHPRTSVRVKQPHAVTEESHENANQGSDARCARAVGERLCRSEPGGHHAVRDLDGVRPELPLCQHLLLGPVARLLRLLQWVRVLRRAGHPGELPAAARDGGGDVPAGELRAALVLRAAVRHLPAAAELPRAAAELPHGDSAQLVAEPAVVQQRLGAASAEPERWELWLRAPAEHRPPGQWLRAAAQLGSSGRVCAAAQRRQRVVGLRAAAERRERQWLRSPSAELWERVCGVCAAAQLREFRWLCPAAEHGGQLGRLRGAAQHRQREPASG